MPTRTFRCLLAVWLALVPIGALVLSQARVPALQVPTARAATPPNTSICGPAEPSCVVSKPSALPTRLPWQAGESHFLGWTYNPQNTKPGFGTSDHYCNMQDAGPNYVTGVMDCYAFDVCPGAQQGTGCAPTTADVNIYPAFAGHVHYVGCATGAWSTYGLVVYITKSLMLPDGSTHEYDAFYTHLASVNLPYGWDVLPGDIGPNTAIGKMGGTVSVQDPITHQWHCDVTSDIEHLHFAMYQDAQFPVASPAGGPYSGSAVIPEPLIGQQVYENFQWWKGPMTASVLDTGSASPGGYWNSDAVPNGQHITYGQPVHFSIHVSDTVNIEEVHITVGYQNWNAPSSTFDNPPFPTQSIWRILSVCTWGTAPSGSCTGGSWSSTSTAQSGDITFDWYPSQETGIIPAVVPWLPSANPAITASSPPAHLCVSFDVVDTAGTENLAPNGIQCTPSNNKHRQSTPATPQNGPGVAGPKPRPRPGGHSDPTLDGGSRSIILDPASTPIFPDAGCTANAVPANDDGGTTAVPLPFTANFLGQVYQSVYVNNNGNLTFNSSNGTYTPYPLSGATQPIIAPYFADVDTRGVGSSLVTYSSGNLYYQSHLAFCVNYVNVGYYGNHTDKLDSFQVLLVDRSDVLPGDFDIIFNYNQMQWETGDASGGVDGLGGTSARAGYSSSNGTWYELPGSGVNGALLDSNTSTGLIYGSQGSTQSGQYIFPIRNTASPTLSVVPASLFLGNQILNMTSSPQSATVTNNGTIPVSISSVSLSGSNPSDFSESDNCAGHTLDPNASCSIAVTFTPSADGQRTATVSISDNALGSPQTVALSGFGLNPTLSIAPTSGAPGSPASMSGTGYGPAETVTILWDCATPNCSNPVLLGGTSTDNNGSFNNFPVTIPASAPSGPHVIGAIGGTTGAFSSTTYAVTTGTNSSTYSAVSTQQYFYGNSDGHTWADVDPSNLSLSLTLTSNCSAVVSGNADLWTNTAGVDQDLGINVSGGSYGSGQLVAWKESGGPATFSPNAAFVQTVIPLTAGTTYTMKLQWKANAANSGIIVTGAGGAAPFSPTRITAICSPSNTVSTSVSTQQYFLGSSDGHTWMDMDPTNLSLSITPTSNCSAVVSGNADLWTNTAHVDQDLGVNVAGGSYGAGQLVAWKESGGPAAFSPNAAFVQTVIPLLAGTTYTMKLQWKANAANAGIIVTGAGSAAPFSPTRITTICSPSNVITSSISNQQYFYGNSDGHTWIDMDPTNLSMSLTPTSNCSAVVSGNADLWTNTAGVDQDLGVNVAGGSYGSGQLVAWKESGGPATFSPNAAFVQTVIPLTAGTTYSMKLQWKANAANTGIIVTGAGGGAPFSPTRITALCVS